MKGIDHKVLCVPCHDPNWSYAERLRDPPQRLLSAGVPGMVDDGRERRRRRTGAGFAALGTARLLIGAVPARSSGLAHAPGLATVAFGPRPRP